MAFRSTKSLDLDGITLKRRDIALMHLAIPHGGSLPQQFNCTAFFDSGEDVKYRLTSHLIRCSRKEYREIRNFLYTIDTID